MPRQLAARRVRSCEFEGAGFIGPATLATAEARERVGGDVGAPRCVALRMTRTVDSVRPRGPPWASR